MYHFVSKLSSLSHNWFAQCKWSFDQMKPRTDTIFMMAFREHTPAYTKSNITSD